MDGLPQELREALEEERMDEEAGDQAVSHDLEGLVTAMIRARDLVDRLEAQLREARAAHDDIRKRALPELMQSLGLVGPDGRGRFTHSSGNLVYLRVKVWASIKKDAQEETFAWLKAHGHGSLVREVVNPQTLSAFVRERIEDGEPLPPGISTAMETVAVIKGAGGSESE